MGNSCKMNVGATVLAALAVMTVSVSGQEYELDPAKVNERRNLILDIVRSAAPYGYQKPRIGSAYVKPARGYNVRGGAYSPPTQYGGYDNRNAQYGSYNPPRGYNSYNVGAYPAVGNAYIPKPSGYYPPNNPLAGYKFGGGRVHPIFNNDLLYRPKVKGGDLGPYNNQDPIFIGGATSKPTTTAFFGQSGVPQKGFGAVRQYDAFGQPGAAKTIFTGSDTIGATYTGQPGTLYQGLPGYTNPYFNKP